MDVMYSDLTANAYLFPAFVQMLLQQVVSVHVLCFPQAFHVLLLHFQAHRGHRVSSTAGKIMSLTSCVYHSQVQR